MTNQETGATLLYQGQRVSFEWQSRQARSSADATCAGTGRIRSRLRSGSVLGFVRAGRMNWPPTSTTAASIPAARATLRITSSTREDEMRERIVTEDRSG